MGFRTGMIEFVVKIHLSGYFMGLRSIVNCVCRSKMQTKEQCFFIRQRNNIEIRFDKWSVSVFLPFDLASERELETRAFCQQQMECPAQKPVRCNWINVDRLKMKKRRNVQTMQKKTSLKIIFPEEFERRRFFPIFSLPSFICLWETITNVDMCTALNKHDNEINEHLQTFSIYFTRKCKRPVS